MEDLHLNYSWINILLVTGFFFAGYVLMTQKLLQQSTELESVNTHLSRENQEREQAEEALKHRFEFEELLAKISSEFINLPASEIDKEINSCLGLLGEFMKVDRVYISEFSEDQSLLSIEYEWTAKNIQPRQKSFQNLEIDSFPWMKERRLRGDTIIIPSIDDLPEEANPEREILAKFDVKSLASVPLFVGGTVLGSVGFDSTVSERNWSDELIKQLKLVGEIFANAITRKRFDEALKESEERLQLATAATQLGTYDWHPLEKKVLWDKRMHELLGLSERSRKDRNEYFFNILHPEDSERIARATDSFMNPKSNETNFKDEYRIILKNEVKHIATQGLGFRNKNGEVTRIIGTCLDITERKKAEEALRESEQRYRSILDDQTEFLVRWLPDGTRTFVNESYCRYYGISNEEATGTSFFPLISEEDREAVRQRVQSITRENPVSTGEHKVILPDGTVDWNQWTDRGIFNEKGKLIEYQSVGRDITERKQAEEALIKNEQLLSSIINNTSAVIYVKAVDGRYLLINKQFEKLFNVTLEEIEGKTDDDIFPKENAAAFRANDLQVVEKGSAIELEEVAPHPDGAHTYISIKFPLFDSTENIYATCGISTDITERKLAEEANLSRLRLAGKRQAAIVKLVTHPAVVSGDLKRAQQVIAQTAAEVFEIERVSIWLLSEDGHELRCIDLYESSKKRHSADTVLLAKDYPRYFEALQAGRAIDASDARTDPRTNEFLEGYLIPLGITSMLDAAIRVSGKPIGIVCHEQVGSARNWTPEETTFAGEIADQVAQVLVNAERKQAEEALRESEEKFRKLSESAFEGIGIVDQGRIIDANKQLADMLGVRLDDLIGMKVVNFVAPQSRQLVAQYAKSGSEHLYEHFARKKDGTIFPVEVRAKSLPFEGQMVRVTAIRDITERKQAEIALRESEETARALLNGTTDMALLIGKDGSIIDLNDAMAERFGSTKEKLIGKIIYDFLPPELAQKRKEKGKEAERTKKPVVFVDQREGIWLENSVSPILDTQGELRRYAIYSRDITERKQAEKKMQQYQDQLRGLSAQLSLAEDQERRRIASDLHDRIGQSLVISKMKLAELRAKANTKDFAKELDEFRETLDQAVKDTRTLTFEISPPILYELGFEAAVEWLTDEFSDTHNLQIKFENDGQPKPLDEPIRIFLFKGVQELLVNIVKHAKAKKVNVSLQKNDKTLKILIRDDGTGFDQSKKRTEMDKSGGFGLFNLRDRLDYYGGKFKVESEPGEGTVVTLVAPLKSLK